MAMAQARKKLNNFILKVEIDAEGLGMGIDADGRWMGIQDRLANSKRVDGRSVIKDARF